MTYKNRLMNRSRRGATMVEFALVFVLFVVVLVAVLEFGRAMWTYATLAHAARQGARFCMIRGELNPTTLEEVRQVVARNAIGLDADKITVAATWDGANDPNAVERGDTIVLTTTYPFEFVSAPLLLKNNTLQMGSKSTMTAMN